MRTLFFLIALSLISALASIMGCAGERLARELATPVGTTPRAWQEHADFECEMLLAAGVVVTEREPDARGHLVARSYMVAAEDARCDFRFASRVCACSVMSLSFHNGGDSPAGYAMQVASVEFDACEAIHFQ